jgi:hypothetical protein
MHNQLPKNFGWQNTLCRPYTVSTMKSHPTHSMEITNGKRVFTDWGTFASDAEAIASATARKLRAGLRVVRVVRAGVVVKQF